MINILEIRTAVMKTEIYTLSHPVTNMVHYVGQSVNASVRLKYHSRSKKVVGEWIQQLAEQGLKPILKVIRVVRVEGAAAAEAKYIERFRTAGHPLLNTIAPLKISYSGMVVIEKSTGKSFESEAQAIRALGYDSVFLFRQDRHLFEYPGWKPRAWGV